MSEGNVWWSFWKFFYVFLTSFILGILFCYYFGSTIGISPWERSSGSKQTLHNTYQDELNLDDFWDVYNILKWEYYSAETVEKKDLEQGMIKWLVESLWDKHSEFLDPENNKKFQEVLSGDFEGIGAVVEKVPLGVQVERILKWSPAKKSGILADDIITSANGEDLEDLWLYEAVEKIKWNAGTIVELKIFRSGEPDFLDISVVRDKIQIPSIESELLDDGVGYIILNLYGETTAVEFKKSLDDLEAQGMRGLIIDVRDNGGGYLQSAVEILSEFIPDGEVVVQTRYRDTLFDKGFYSSNKGTFDKPIVVLVNGNSASASEITAGTLREYNKAIIVWEKTYGKWSVQQPFDIGAGGLLKLTIANWYTPKWKSIEWNGIEPDIEVLFEDEDRENQYDRQLEEAKKILQKFQSIGTLQLSVDQYKNEQASQ